MRVRTRLRRQINNTRLGFRISSAGADLRSRLLLIVLAAGAILKQNTRWSRTEVRLNVRLAGEVFSVSLAGRTELEVLREIIADEYALPDRCRPNVILDLGAHIGLAALYLHARRPAARIVCVEADPRLVPQLRANVEPHGIEVIHAAVTADPGPVTFYVSPDSWGNSLTQLQPQQVPVLVDGMTYDQITQLVDDTVGLLKIDIEGAEWDVFASGALGDVDFIVGETHAAGGLHSRRALDPLRATMSIRTTREVHGWTVFWAERFDAGTHNEAA